MIATLSFGCRLNALESEAMRARAAETATGDLLLVNTCAVTAEAVRQARQAIRRAKRQRPDRPIVVSGCAAQIDPSSFAAMPEVDRVLGNAEKMAAASYGASDRVMVGELGLRADPGGLPTAGIEGRTRGLLMIQNGCDHRCTFCTIPFGRGPSRSVPLADLVNAARSLHETDHAEIVLTGVDITSYGADLPERPTLGLLVRAILAALPGLARLRLSSIDAAEIDPALLVAFAEEGRLMPQLHLSLQSGDDLILKRMKRRHSRRDAVALTDRIRAVRPDMVFSADLIAGFPTETEEAFRNSVALVDDCGLSQLHVFPFSARPGTPAARMPQLDAGLIRDRAARLRAHGDAARRRHLLAEVGHRRKLLIERGGLGRTEHFVPVRIKGVAPGVLVDATITRFDGSDLHAEPQPEAA